MHEIKLTDGTTTVNLNDGTSVWTTGYSLATPAPGATDCTDSIELLFLVPTATMRSVEAMVERAAMRQRTRRGKRIYVTVKMTGDSETWRAELLQGQLMSEALIDETFIGKVRATLVLQRVPFWEGAEAEIPLVNWDMYGSDDPATGGVPVPNDPDVGCWVEIDAADVAGAIPAPVRLRIENAEAGAQFYRYIFAANNVFSVALNASSAIQAEDETSGLGTDSASVVYSNGFQWTTESFTTVDELLGKWAFPAALVEESAGRWWRMIARITAYTDAHDPVLWPVLYDASGLVVLWTGPEVRPGPAGELLDFGPIPLPPGPYDSEYDTCVLGLYGRASEPTTVALDYFYLLPMDALRFVEQVAVGVDSGDWIEFDEIEGRYYAENATGRTAVHVPSEAPLIVWPGLDQRVHILYRTTSAMTVGDEATISMWYRPRRLTL